MRRLGARFGRRLGAQRSSGSTQEWPQSGGAAFWFDPTTGYTTATGVDSWTDRIGGYAATNSTGSQQPTISATGLAGSRQGFLFTRASSQRLAGGSTLAALLNNNAPYSIFYRYKSTNLTGSADVVFTTGTVASSTTHVLAHGYALSAGTNRSWVTRATLNTTGSIDLGAAGEHTVSGVYNGSTYSEWVDGVLAINAFSVTQSLACDVFAIGSRRRAATYDAFMGGIIGDIVGFTSALGTTDRQAGEAWFAARYA